MVRQVRQPYPNFETIRNYKKWPKQISTYLVDKLNLTKLATDFVLKYPKRESIFAMPQ